MARGRDIARMALAAMLVFAFGACASSAKLSSKSLCENAGGTYAQGTCQPGSARKAEAMCLGFGGVYLAGEDLCHIPIK